MSNLENNTSSLEKLLERANSLPSAVTDAVRYSPQTLTEEQQVQARSNIGAASEKVVTDLARQIVSQTTIETMINKKFNSIVNGNEVAY